MLGSEVVIGGTVAEKGWKIDFEVTPLSCSLKPNLRVLVITFCSKMPLTDLKLLFLGQGRGHFSIWDRNLPYKI